MPLNLREALDLDMLLTGNAYWRETPNGPERIVPESIRIETRGESPLGALLKLQARDAEVIAYLQGYFEAHRR